MRRWLSTSVVTTALSLTVLLVCFSLDSDSDMTSVRVDRYACMGCQSGQSWHVATYFPAYNAAACHYARSRACNQSYRSIWLVTIQSIPSDRDAGGAGASGPWPPASPNPPGSEMSYIPIRLYTTFATYHLLFGYGRWYLAKNGLYNQKNAFLTSQGLLSRLYTMLYSQKSAI